MQVNNTLLIIAIVISAIIIIGGAIAIYIACGRADLRDEAQGAQPPCGMNGLCRHHATCGDAQCPGHPGGQVIHANFSSKDGGHQHAAPAKATL